MRTKPTQLETGEYTGVDNLEVMAVALKYRRFLAGCVAAADQDRGTAGAIADFGAGTGTHARDLAALGYDVSCIELDDTLAARLRSDGFTTVSSPADLPEQSFSVVYTFNVLEHIDDDEGALRSLARLVAPDGRIVVYVPAIQALYTSMDAKVGHLRRYRRRDLVQLAERAGFTKIRAEYVDSLGFFATLAYKLVGNDRGDISERSIGFYDRFAFPVSRVLDRATQRLFGKNLLLVAEPTRS